MDQESTRITLRCRCGGRLDIIEVAKVSVAVSGLNISPDGLQVTAGKVIRRPTFGVGATPPVAGARRRGATIGQLVGAARRDYDRSPTLRHAEVPTAGGYAYRCGRCDAAWRWEAQEFDRAAKAAVARSAESLDAAAIREPRARRSALRIPRASHA